jgi:hypothetical protein
MVKQSVTSPYPGLSPFLGFNAQGNLGPFTCYVGRHRKIVWYLTTPQKEPPSFYRDVQKRRLAAAAATWNRLTPEQRSNWSLACSSLRLRIHGYDLWTFWQLRHDRPTIATIERHAGLELIPT